MGRETQHGNEGSIAWLRSFVGTARLLYPVGVACVRDGHGRFLLQARTDFVGLWCCPGGGIDLGETAEEAACREALEETGVTVEALRLLGVYSGPRYATRYPNGDMTQPVALAFLCRPLAGELRADGVESAACDWFAPDALPALTVESADIIRDALAERVAAFSR
ncbi:MAG TPA: NUDIX domain-containing protein [Thermomicrobiales bacterium]